MNQHFDLETRGRADNKRRVTKESLLAENFPQKNSLFPYKAATDLIGFLILY